MQIYFSSAEDTVRKSSLKLPYLFPQTEHILLGGKGANAFARTMGVPEVPTEELITENRLRALKTRAGYTPTVKFMYKAE